MTCQLRIDANILKQPVAYKYVIYSPKTRKDKDMQYEVIHYSNPANPNRALCIPENMKKSYGGKIQFNCWSYM